VPQLMTSISPIVQNLSPSRTFVEQRQNPPPSPGPFVAMHPDNDANSVLREWRKEGQRAAFQVFLDCLYAECGYVPWYLRDDYGNLIQPQSRLQRLVRKTKRKRTSQAKAKQVIGGAETSPSPVDEESQILGHSNLSHTASPSEDASSGYCQYSEQETKRYVCWEAVKHKIETGEMGKVVTGDLIYLAGGQCGYYALHTSHHSMLLTVLAVQLERITAPFSTRRKDALKRAFEWLTGYKNYSDAWKNPNEKRILTDKGIVGGDLGFS
jgi:hypothetical protein